MELIAEAGWDPAFGARPLKRAIQRLDREPARARAARGPLRRRRRRRADGRRGVGRRRAMSVFADRAAVERRVAPDRGPRGPARTSGRVALTIRPSCDTRGGTDGGAGRPCGHAAPASETPRELLAERLRRYRDSARSPLAAVGSGDARRPPRRRDRAGARRPRRSRLRDRPGRGGGGDGARARAPTGARGAPHRRRRWPRPRRRSARDRRARRSTAISRRRSRSSTASSPTRLVEAARGRCPSAPILPIGTSAAVGGDRRGRARRGDGGLRRPPRRRRSPACRRSRCGRSRTRSARPTARAGGSARRSTRSIAP